MDSRWCTYLWGEMQAAKRNASGAHSSSHILSNFQTEAKGKGKGDCFWRSEGFWPLLCRSAQRLKRQQSSDSRELRKETCNRVTLNSVAGHRSRQGNKWISVEWFWFGGSILSNIIPRVHSKQRQPHNSFGIISATCHSICAREANWLREVCQKHSSSDLPWSSNILQVF